MSTLLVCTESSLPPNIEGRVRGYLEIEIIHISLFSQPVSRTIPEIPKCLDNIKTPSGKKSKRQQKDNRNNKSIRSQIESLVGLTVKYIWYGETTETASCVKIIVTAKKLKCGKVRYNIETCLKLFYEYILSCGPVNIRINSTSSGMVIGIANVHIPSEFLRQFPEKAEYLTTFEESTKAFPIFNENDPSIVTGEIKLKFKMIFQDRKESTDRLESNNSCILSCKENHSSMEIKNSLMDYIERIKLAEEEAEKCGSSSNVNPLPISKIINDLVTSRFRAKQCTVYNRVNSITIHIETLTLQAEGTRIVRLPSLNHPEFTIDSRITRNLLDGVQPTRDYNRIYFKSKHFHDTQQCAEFHCEDTREIHIDCNEFNNSVIQHANVMFTIFWCENDSEFSQMLGTGRFSLTNLFNASLLEQRKRLPITSCAGGFHVADIVCKISLGMKDGSQFEMNLLEELAMDEILRKEQICVEKDNEMRTTKILNSNPVTCDSKITSTTTTTTAAANNVSTIMPLYNTKALLAMKIPEENNNIRLLKGFISVTKSRNLPKVKCGTYTLGCRRFWKDEPIMCELKLNTDVRNELPDFNYQELFLVVNDCNFIQLMEKNYLELSLWYKKVDGAELVGRLKLPLHQFFIAYRDSAITNRLSKEKLPVISIDGWSPLFLENNKSSSGGEMKCLLAIGTDEQIFNLKQMYSIDDRIARQPINLKHLKAPLEDAASWEILNSLTKNQQNDEINSIINDAIKLVTKNKFGEIPSSMKDLKTFRMLLEVENAINLPNYSSQIKPKKSTRRINVPSSNDAGGSGGSSGGKIKQPRASMAIEKPSTYITFQAKDCNVQPIKSHEGMVYATHVCEKQTEPRWSQRFNVIVSTDYLIDNKKRFILRVWKKTPTDLPRCRAFPTPMEDSIIGCISMDLSVLIDKMPRISGWFNIVDYNGRINGMLQINCESIDDLNPFRINWQKKEAGSDEKIKIQNNQIDKSKVESNEESTSLDNIDYHINQLNIPHHLDQDIQMKFIELEGISKRLREKLSNVIGDSEFPLESFNSDGKMIDLDNLSNFESIDGNDGDDDELREFENDLNTSCGNDEENDNWTFDNSDEKIQMITEYLQENTIGIEKQNEMNIKEK